MANEWLGKDGYARKLIGQNQAMLHSPQCCATCGPGCVCALPCVAAFANQIREREYRVLPIALPPGLFPVEVISQSEPVTCCCGPVNGTAMRGFRQTFVYFTGGGNPGPNYPLRYRYEVTEWYDPNVSPLFFTRYESWDYGYGAGGPLTHDVFETSYQPPEGYCIGNEFRGGFPLADAGGCTGIGIVGVSGGAFSSCTVQTADYIFDSAICPFPGIEPTRTVFKCRRFLEPNTSVCKPPTTCGSACCLPEGTCRDGLSPSACAALGGIHKPNQTCYSAGCDDPENKGACCSPSTGNCVLSLPEECEIPNTFGGIGSTCEPTNPCPQPLGRCCRVVGFSVTCSISTEANCTQLGGTWGGWGSTCESLPCQQLPGGACCKPDGSCEQMTQAECSAINGIFSLGGDCQAISCVGACCTAGVCSITTPQMCAGNGGVMTGGTSCNPDPCNVNGGCCCPTSHGLTCGVTSMVSCLAGNCAWLGAGTNCSGPNPCGIPPEPLWQPSYTRGKPSERIVIPGQGRPLVNKLGCSTCGASNASGGLLI